MEGYFPIQNITYIVGHNGEISTDCITSFKYEEKETIQGTDFFVPIIAKANEH